MNEHEQAMIHFLQSKRQLSQDQVDRLAHERDASQGLYLPHGLCTHHHTQESRH